MTALTIIFWICAFVVFYTFFGYGIIIWIAVKIKERFSEPENFPVKEEFPDVTLLIAAYNEEDIIAQKMENCRALKYPHDKLHLVWVTDGSTDSTPKLLSEYPENTVLHQPGRSGKTEALNRAMRFVNTPYVIMTDANTALNEEAIYLIIRKFDNPNVGCVAGEKKVISSGDNAAATEGLYWKYESFLKDLDDRLNSAMGAAGELIAIRRELWTDIPKGTLGDDMFVSMGVIRKGYKIAYCKQAYAAEKPSADIREERKRKVRLAGCAMQNVVTLRDLMNPFKYGLTAFQFVSHRVLRWVLTPSCLILLLLSNLVMVLMGAPLFYQIVLGLQVLFYLAALAGMILDRKEKAGILRVPYYFLFTNFTTFAGVGYLLRNKGNAAWEKARRA
ncbi:MAG: glycosyltransferase family 2 protein [Candidatus Cryptobacteroides sp.]